MSRKYLFVAFFIAVAKSLRSNPLVLHTYFAKTLKNNTEYDKKDYGSQPGS